MTQIQLPNEWQPRRHQLPVWNAMQNGCRRAALIWHRRAGKDSFSINFLATYAMQHKGVYWHMLPSATQGRKVIWDGIDFYGRRIIDQAFPKIIRKRTNDQEMKIELINGSIIQIVGSDNFDSLVGANPKGVIFSEYSIANPLAWNYIRPILRENGGFAIFIYTPRGRNHGYRLYENATDEWYKETLTVEDTVREDGITPIMTPEDIEDERRSGMTEDMIQQEYYSSFNGGMEGAFYTAEVNDILDNRMGNYPHDPERYCISAWDLGVRDKTAIGIFQSHPSTGAPVLIDAFEDRNKGLPYYIKNLRDMPYNFHYHYAPHDIEQREYTSGRSRLDIASDLGIEFDVVPKLSVEDGINSCRGFLRTLFVNDTPNTRKVLDMLSSYHREYDPKRDLFSDRPVHDFSSDTADMMRYASIMYDPSLLKSKYAYQTSFKAKRSIGRY